MESIKFLIIGLKRGLITSVFALAVFNAQGQTIDYVKPMTDQTPKTPDAAALDKFVDIPPSPYSGTTSISVPIYTIEVNGESFPISLDHHLSGVKVGEVASRIGLGWSLNVGNLSLSKQTVGYNDEGFVQTYDPRDFVGDYWGQNDASVEDFLVARLATGILAGVRKDTQPDFYSYSVNGQSGKFIRDSSGAIQKIPYNSLKIEGHGYPFVFTDNKGIKYYFSFGGSQSTVSVTTEIDNNSFKIDKIIFLNGQEIIFNYRSINYSYIINRTQNLTIDVEGLCEIENGHIGDLDEKLFRTNNRDMILTDIIFPNGKVIFKYSDEKSPSETRKDVLNDVYCTSIIVKNRADIAIKDYSFNQSYFESMDLDTPYFQNLHPSLHALREGLKYRLKLNIVVDNISGTNHTFTYHQEMPLPNRLSPDTDYWGVYNGANNETPLPKILYKNRFYGTANKNSNFSYGVLGALKEVKFPTGGIQKFTYEQDDYFQQDNYTTLVDTIYNLHEFKIETPLTHLNNVNYPFYLNGDIDQSVEFESSNNPLGDCTDCLPIPGSNYSYGVILNESKVEIARFYLNKKYNMDLPKNKLYYLKIMKFGSAPTTGTLKINWYTSTIPPIPLNRKVGTLRVKSIVLQSGTGKDIRKTYSYLIPNTINSSGVNHGDKITSLLTAYSTGSGLDEGLDGSGTCKKVLLAGNSGINLSSVNGKSIGYDYARETQIDDLDGESIGSILYKFSNILDDAIQSSQYTPIIPREDRSFERGLLLEKKVYSKVGTIMNATFNEYETDLYYNQFSSMLGGEGGIAMCIKIELIRTQFNYMYFFRSRQYSIPSGWVKLLQTKNIDYFNGQEVTSIITNTYSPDYKHIFPIKTSTTTSNGSIVENSYVYPADIPNEPAMADLIADNRIAQPVEMSVSINGSKSWQEKTTYAKNPDTDTIAMPTAIYAAKFPNNLPIISGEVQLEKKISFNRYKSGKVVEYAIADGPSTTLLWGYNNQNMIAKIENASFSSFQNQYAYIQSTSDNFINLNVFQSSLVNLRVNLAPPTSMVTTYAHIPLIGISKITDQKNESATYSYDSAGRLKLVKDNQSKILLENFYNYKP